MKIVTPFLFRYFWILGFFALSFLSCNREKDLVRIGMELEANGDEIQAIYYYDLALKQNQNYATSHKKMGFLLAKSDKSTGIATYHLERAWELDPDDLETGIRLYLQYLSIGKLDLARDLVEELKIRLSGEMGIFLDNLLICTENPLPKKWDGGNLLSPSPEYAGVIEPFQKFCQKKMGETKP